MPTREESPPETPPADASRSNQLTVPSADRGGLSSFLEGAIFFFLCLFAILLPHSIKGAQHSWQIAFLFWMAKLAVERKRPFPQPLSAPLLVFVTLSAISTALSPDPYLSWDRMKLVCLVLAGIVVAQSLQRLTQVRILVFLLILSGLAVAVFTAWQYTYGVGVRVALIAPQTPLYKAHVHHDDIITHINGHSVHTPAQLERIIEQSPPGTLFRIDYLRGFPFQKEQTFVTREQVMKSAFGTYWLQFARGRPFRAQGTLGHYVVFAEMLMQLGCMSWAMLLSTAPRKTGLWLLFALTFAALAVALLLSETRAALAGLAAGCFVALWALAGKRVRVWATSLLVFGCVAGGLWMYHARGLSLEDTHDPGTQFRRLMWEDGVRLARQHPWFGVGMETTRVHWQEWNIRGFALYHVQSHFHSTPLQIAVERGLPALIAWVWFVVAYLVFLVRLLRRTRERSRFAAGVVGGVLAGFVAFQTTSLVHYNLGEEPLVMILFFYFGLALAIDRMLKTPGAVDVP